MTADDDLGRVEIGLKELMHNEKTKNKMCDREDRLKGEDSSEEMPGYLSFSVGYFEKTRITDEQLKIQTYNKHILTKEEMKRNVAKTAERKLREAYGQKGMDEELHQQVIEDYKEEEDNMMITAPPSKDHKSGLLSIQIHNITGLEVTKPNYEDPGDQAPDAEDNESTEHLPDSYCTIILNHEKIYRTRTKPKNAKPFFNASTERFVKDRTTYDFIISCRDSREREDDALLGVIYLPLWKVFEKRSQIMENFPLAGGIGYGWDYGTLEIKGGIRAKSGLAQELQQHRLKAKTTLTKTRMYSQDGSWLPRSKHDERSVFLAVRRRYATPLIIEFRKSSIGPDKTPAFSVLWLHEIVDEEWETRTLPVWKGGKVNIKKGTSCCDYERLEKDGQKLGEIEITLKLWRGLSGYHKKHAQADDTGRMRDVMECLDTINDEEMDKYSDDGDHGSDTSTETECEGGGSKQPKPPRHKNGGDGMDDATREKLKLHTNKGNEESGSDEENVESTGGLAKITAPVTAIKDGVSSLIDKVTSSQDNQTEGSPGVRAQIADYKSHHKQLHRKHRGIMQWKSARTLDWAGGKIKRSKNRLSGVFSHSEKDQGIETEV
ncbi:hypothetical protein LTR66_016979 [Elasticomyces elasticus]|nr:hypothetical protein LTR66_016979 [Elasticomyces elasticus]